MELDIKHFTRFVKGWLDADASDDLTIRAYALVPPRGSLSGAKRVKRRFQLDSSDFGCPPLLCEALDRLARRDLQAGGLEIAEGDGLRLLIGYARYLDLRDGAQKRGKLR